MAVLERLPVETTVNIIQQLNSYLDLSSAIRAGPCLLRAFKTCRLATLVKVARNAIEPEALGDALSASLCPRTSHLPWDDAENRAIRQAEYQRQVSQHVRRLPQMDSLPFPTELSKLVPLQYLSRTVNKTIERFEAISWDRNMKHLAYSDRMYVMFLRPPLTRRERADLQKALFQYELVTRTMGLGGGDYPNLSMGQEEEVLSRLDGLEMQQFLTVHNWILEDYRSIIAEFESGFITAVKSAIYNRTMDPVLCKRGVRCNTCTTCTSTCASGSATSAPTGAHHSHGAHGPRKTINASDAVRSSAAALPYFSSASSRPGPNTANERHTNESFNVVLQSFGLGLYRLIADAGAERRRDILTSSYWDVVHVDREWFANPFRRYCARYECPIQQLKDEYNQLLRLFSRGASASSSSASSSPLSMSMSMSMSPAAAFAAAGADLAPEARRARAREEARDNLCGNLDLPNELLARYVEMLAGHGRPMGGEDRFYLISSGWWFWEDRRLDVMAFRRHGLFTAAAADAARSAAAAAAAAASWSSSSGGMGMGMGFGLGPGLPFAPAPALALAPTPTPILNLVGGPAAGLYNIGGGSGSTNGGITINRAAAVLDEYTDQAKRGRNTKQPVVQDELARLRLEVDVQDWEDLTERYRVGRSGSGGEGKDVLRDLVELDRKGVGRGWGGDGDEI